MEKLITYSIAVPDDYDEIIEHANFVFSYAHQPHEFKTLIPKAYGAERTMWPEHFLAREDGRIRGLVGLMPFTQRVMDTSINVGFIGTVSVHPYSRSMGHMKKCMATSTEYARAHGIDLMALGGQRQRYEYYGYEPGGTVYHCSINRTNCRHKLSALDASDISFVPFAGIRARMSEIHAIYDSGIVAGARPEHNFEQICSTWRNLPFAILRGDAVIGYLIASGDRESITELRLTDDSDFNAVIKAYLTHFSVEEVRLSIPPHRTADLRPALKLCEGYKLSTNEMFMILNYEKVVTTYLRLKHQIAPLPNGSTTLGITGINGDSTPQSLTISITDGIIDCRFTDQAPDLILNTIDAQNLLLSPQTYVDTTSLPDYARLFFPLPLYIESADGF